MMPFDNTFQEVDKWMKATLNKPEVEYPKIIPSLVRGANSCLKYTLFEQNKVKQIFKRKV